VGVDLLLRGARWLRAADRRGRLLGIAVSVSIVTTVVEGILINLSGADLGLVIPALFAGRTQARGRRVVDRPSVQTRS